MVQALLDNGCLCSGIIDDNLVTQLKLLRYPIAPQFLETAESSSTNKPVVNLTTCVSVNLDGHLTPNLCLYVVPRSTHRTILGKKWLEDQDAIIHSREQFLELRKSNRLVYSARRWRGELRGLARPGFASAYMTKEMVRKVPICKASLEDINKALRTKPAFTIEEAERRLPAHVKELAHPFADNEGAEDLPPLRGSLDHAINLRREEGKTPTRPWEPLYYMFREKLLALRKTLTDLLKNGWTRPSNSPAAVPVLFARKPNGGPRLCADYRGLNAITTPDRYPLPLFKEPLRRPSRARWFTKLDIKSPFHRLRIR